MDGSLESPAEDAVALVVFGLDQGGKAHASRFSLADAPLAEKAAGLMGMHILRPATDDHRALAAQLPPGRVFASGRGFVPFVKAAVFEALAGAAGVSATRAAKPRQKPPVASLGQLKAMPTGTPAATFAEIGVGSIVLACETGGDRWFNAVVLKTVDDKATLMWPDYPDHPKFSRRLWQLGLLPPLRKSA